jgi:hypothetical protein
MWARRWGFVVERRRPLGDWMSTTVSGGSIRSWADATVQPGLFYEYRVAAVLSNGVSERSEIAYIQMPSLPLAPDSLGASLAEGGGVALAWQDRSHNEEGFEVWRTAGAAGVWESIARTAADATGHLDPAVAPATLYTYKVRAFNSWGNSGFSGESSLVTPPPAEGCGFELIVEEAAIRLDGWRRWWAARIRRTAVRCWRAACRPGSAARPAIRIRSGWCLASGTPPGAPLARLWN